MKTSETWFRHAGAGMFIHWGVYSAIGRGEWVLEQERMPLDEYDQHVPQFTAECYDPGEWARLAKAAGMRYLVLTAKHLDGFCLFDTATTGRNALKRGPRRDLVREYVEACRGHGLKVGLYLCLSDLSFPVAKTGPAHDPGAWTEYVELIHRQVGELCGNYGKIDLLWYDNIGYDFMTAANLRSQELNAMARRLQPGILLNDRSYLPEDYYTAEQHVKAPDDPGRAWEACLTMNKHWGCFPADDMYKSAKEIVHTLTAIAMNRGNMLLNVGPKPDGTIGEPEQERLKALGQWLEVHREAVEAVSPCPVSGGTYGCAAMKGDDVYLYVHWWNGSSLVIADCAMDFSSGVILGTNQPVAIRRDGSNIILLELPATAPDPLCTVIKLTRKT